MYLRTEPQVIRKVLIYCEGQAWTHAYLLLVSRMNISLTIIKEKWNCFPFQMIDVANTQIDIFA